MSGSWMPVLHRWYTVGWLCFGIAPSVIGLGNDQGAGKILAVVLLPVLCLGYGAIRLFPGDRSGPGESRSAWRRAEVLRPVVYLTGLALIVGVMAALPGGGVALLIVSLPQFWIFAPGRASANTLAGLATGATIAFAAIAAPGLPVGTILFALGGYGAAVLLGVLFGRLVAEGGLLRAELDRAEERLAEAHRRQGAAEERERLAREIHDTVTQGLASIIVLAEAALSDPSQRSARLRSIERTARENFAEARALVTGGHVAADSFVETLGRVVERFGEDTGLSVVAELSDVECDRAGRIALLRCAQESLANVRKHAGASTVGVVVTRVADAVELEITDDGRGFVPSSARGYGLDGMRRRLGELGGLLTVTSAPGAGTRVLATIPVEAL